MIKILIGAEKEGLTMERLTRRGKKKQSLGTVKQKYAVKLMAVFAHTQVFVTM